MEPQFFSPAEFRQWLAANHSAETEVLVGFYKKASGKVRMTWSEAVDEALCYGWIDSRGNRIDDERNTIRFTPRRRRSNWSQVNIAKVADLTARGLMHPAGLAAFEARTEDKSRIYSYENRPTALPPEYEATFRANAPAAWAFFDSQAPSYRRSAMYWVLDAKREETRLRRLATLIEDSANGRRIAPFRRRE